MWSDGRLHKWFRLIEILLPTHAERLYLSRGCWGVRVIACQSRHVCLYITRGSTVRSSLHKGACCGMKITVAATLQATGSLSTEWVCNCVPSMERSVFYQHRAATRAESPAVARATPQRQIILQGTTNFTRPSAKNSGRLSCCELQLEGAADGVGSGVIRVSFFQESICLHFITPPALFFLLVPGACSEPCSHPNLSDNQRFSGPARCFTPHQIRGISKTVESAIKLVYTNN